MHYLAPQACWLVAVRRAIAAGARARERLARPRAGVGQTLGGEGVSQGTERVARGGMVRGLVIPDDALEGAELVEVDLGVERGEEDVGVFFLQAAGFP